MKTVEFDKIFHITNDGVYYDGGKIDFSSIQLKNGFHCEIKLQDGEFIACFFDLEETVVIFPFNKFGQGQKAVKGARAKCGSFALFLEGEGLKVKTHVIS